MDKFDSDSLPPELNELGKRVRNERPVPSDRTLDRVMTRAQGARRSPKPSLLWSRTAPQAPKRFLAFCAAAVMATGGMTAVASAVHIPGHADAAQVQYTCAEGEIRVAGPDGIFVCISSQPLVEVVVPGA